MWPKNVLHNSLYICFNGLAMLLRGSHKVGIAHMQVTFYMAFGWSAKRIPPAAEPWKLYANAYDGSKTKIYIFPKYFIRL